MTPSSFDTYRPKLFGIAYRMLGLVTEAEDMVQDAYVKYLQASERTAIENPEAYLVTTVTRLCIDQLRSARVKRESYVGPWLPEPLVSDADVNPELQQELAETLSFAFMLLLEQLNPVERAVYILREAFDFKHAEIASILGRQSAADSRQLSRRAKQRLQSPETRFAARDSDQQRLFESFLQAASGDDLQGLFDCLADDIVVHTDGGGKVRAALRVLEGKARVIEFIRRVLPQVKPGSTLSLCEVNGQPAIRQSVEGRTAALVSAVFVAGRVQQLYIVRNPDKLHESALPHTVV